MKKLVFLALLLFPALALAQIPSGYVEATATVPILANGYFGAAWTNLSSSPQLGLLGCVSTFQTTVNGTIDSYGKFSVLLADPAQICPSPSTWTFTFSCYTPPGAFITPITVTGGGSTDDISAQIIAAAPANICHGGGSGLTITTTTPIKVNGANGPVSSGTALISCDLATNTTTGCLRPDGTTCTVSAGVLTCPGGSGTTTDFEHNDTLLTGQFAPIAGTQIFDLNDTTPTAPGGDINCTWQTDPATGRVSCYVPASSIDLQQVVTPPVPGQSVTIYPTAYTLIVTPPLISCGPTATAVATATGTSASGVFLLTGCSTGLGGGDAGAIYTGFSLPSYVNPADVTAIYAVGVAGYPANAMTPNITLTQATISCKVPTFSPVEIFDTRMPDSSTQQQFSGLMGGYVGTDIPNIQCTAQNALGADPFGSGSIFNVQSLALVVYYTGTAPPAPTPMINVISPLYYNSATGDLGIDTSYPFPGYNLQPVTIAAGTNQLPDARLYPSTVFLVSDGATSTDCSTGSGTNSVFCLSNGTSYSAFGGGSGGTTTFALTAAATGGATPGSTFNGSAAVTFDYHSFGAQPALSLLEGTYSDGDVCTYTASGTLLNCNIASASADTASTIVARDSSGNFSAGTITANLTGTASKATNLVGGATGSVPYQSAANTTLFLASPTTSGHAFFLGWEPSGSALAPVAYDLGSYLGTNVTAASPIVATPSTLGVAFSCPTCGTSSGGTTVTVNGGFSLASLDINATAPVADSSYLALLPKISGASMIIEAPYATGAAFGVMEGDASTLTMTAGVASCTTATSSQIGCSKPDGTILTISAGAETVAKATSAAFGVIEGDGSTLSLSAGVASCTTATSSQIGCSKPDGTILTISAGAETVAKGSSSLFGVVKVDNTTITASGGVISALSTATNYQTLSYPNDSTGTANGLMACWTGHGAHGQNTIQTCPTSYGGVNGGTDNPAPIVGIVISGGGTTGSAVVAVSGSGVPWKCDGTVGITGLSNYWLQLSSTTAGECSQPSGSTFSPTPNENPEINTVLAYVTTANSGAGTAATVSLLPSGSYVPNASGGESNLVLQPNASNFQSLAHWFQMPSTSATPYDLGCYPACGLAIPQANGFSSFYTHIGSSTNGVSGRDTLIDLLTHGYGTTGHSQLEINGQTWQPPVTGGSWTGSLSIDIGQQTNIIAATLAGNTTLTLTDENAGHYQMWDLKQAASGGPYAVTWPGDFVNPPVVSATASAYTLFLTYYDGTNHRCVWGCNAVYGAVFQGTGTGPAIFQLPLVNYSVLNAAFTCNSGNAGMHATVNDAPTDTWGAAISPGGGSFTEPAFCNGSAWVVK